MTDNPELDWFKSSYSDSGDVNDCVEVAWFKSTYSSSSEGDDCVEVATTPAAVLVRDSKDTDIPHLAFGPAAWAGFVASAR